MELYDNAGWPVKKTVQGSIELQDVKVLPKGERCGHDDRVNAIEHVAQMAERGYLKQEEANQRIKYIEDAERQAVLTHLTSDLPPRLHPSGKIDWKKPAHYVPACVGGMCLSALLASVVPTMLGAMHQFPDTALGLGLGIPALIIGILGFAVFLITLCVLGDE